MRVGAVLSDQSIRDCVKLGVLIIEPFDPRHLQPASYDVMLAQDVTLAPFEFKLASSIERFKIGIQMRGDLATRSSVARLGVFAHLGAGFFDPGFDGEATLELFNASRTTQTFSRGDRVAQMAFTWLDSEPSRSYAGRYVGQRGPTDSRFGHGDL